MPVTAAALRRSRQQHKDIKPRRVGSSILSKGKTSSLERSAGKSAKYAKLISEITEKSRKHDQVFGGIRVKK